MTHRPQSRVSGPKKCRKCAVLDVSGSGCTTVTLTLGNAPVADLLVATPTGAHFMVDVKGQSTRNFWLIAKREPREDLYYILVYLPKLPDPPRFFIFRSRELMEKREEYRQHIEAQGGKYRDETGGINLTLLD